MLPSAVVPLRQHLFFMLSSARFSLPKAGFVISPPEIACLRTESANMSSDFPAAIYKTGNKLSHTREIGRIIAFAGERFTVRGGLIYIDNKLLDESEYAVPFDSEIDLSELIPTDCFLVLPDDRSELAPQQVQAFIIPRSRIIGEIRLRLFPLNEIAVFS